MSTEPTMEPTTEPTTDAETSDSPTVHTDPLSKYLYPITPAMAGSHICIICVNRLDATNVGPRFILKQCCHFFHKSCLLSWKPVKELTRGMGCKDCVTLRTILMPDRGEEEPGSGVWRERLERVERGWRPRKVDEGVEDRDGVC